MPIQDAQSIRQLALGHFRDPEIVRTITQRIGLLEGAHNRRQALSALVDQLLAAGELDAAVSAARLAPDLTPITYVNNVDYWLKGALLLKIVDQLLARQEPARAVQLLDEATLGLDQLNRYEPFDLPAELPWFQLTQRYKRVDRLGRVYHIWDTVIAWARAIEQSLAVPDPAWFQPEDGSRFLVGIVAEMLQLGQHERAQATAGAIRHEPHRTQALALLSANLMVEILAPMRQLDALEGRAGSGPSAQSHDPGASAPTPQSDAEALVAAPQPVSGPEAAQIDVGAAVARVRQLLTRHQGLSAERAGALARAGELLAEPGLARLREAGAPAVDLWEQARRELAALLAGFDGPGAGAITPGERVRAGRALGLLGDPRVPLDDAEWRASLAHLSTALTASGAHYWRYVPAGDYWIGGWAEYDPYAGPMQRDQWLDRVPLAAFWLARLPVTVAQFARFVADGYWDAAHWTPYGLQWRNNKATTRSWGEPQYRGANQPVVYVNWYEATAYCRWLSARLDVALPAGYTLRLPSEAEREVAAYYDGTEQRRPHPWGSAQPTAERAVTAAWRLSAAAPVGLCPAGMAACGALDLVGEVREWSGSAEESYPKRANTLVHDQPMYQASGPLSVPARGVSWMMNPDTPTCGARSAGWPNHSFSSIGLRLALAPRPG